MRTVVVLAPQTTRSPAAPGEGARARRGRRVAAEAAPQRRAGRPRGRAFSSAPCRVQASVARPRRQQRPVVFGAAAPGPPAANRRARPRRPRARAPPPPGDLGIAARKPLAAVAVPHAHLSPLRRLGTPGSGPVAAARRPRRGASPRRPRRGRTPARRPADLCRRGTLPVGARRDFRRGLCFKLASQAIARAAPPGAARLATATAFRVLRSRMSGSRFCEGHLEAHPRFVVDVAARVEAAERRVEPRSRSGVIQ